MACAVILAVLLCLPLPALAAQQHQAGTVTQVVTPPAKPASAVRVDNAWVRLLPGALPAAGYFTLYNDGTHPLQLVGASATDWHHVGLHHSMEHGGESTMAPVSSLTVPAHGSVSFTPGGYHLMLRNARGTLKVGDHAVITLHFANGATQNASFLLRPANAIGP